jgi:hypothetical protein
MFRCVFRSAAVGTGSLRGLSAHRPGLAPAGLSAARATAGGELRCGIAGSSHPLPAGELSDQPSRGSGARLDLASGPAPSPLLVLGSARCQLTFAIRMVLQLSAQDIGQLPYFEVGQRSSPSLCSVCATSPSGSTPREADRVPLRHRGSLGAPRDPNSAQCPKGTQSGRSPRRVSAARLGGAPAAGLWRGRKRRKRAP